MEGIKYLEQLIESKNAGSGSNTEDQTAEDKTEKYWEEIPDEIKEAPKYKRLEWYTNRASRYIPAWDFLDKLDHGLSLEELYDELEKTIKTRKRLEHIIFTMESGKFRELHAQLVELVKEIKRLQNQRISYLLLKDHQKVSHCLSQISIAVKLALELEEEIKIICTESEIDSNTYLLVHTLRIRD